MRDKYSAGVAQTGDFETSSASEHTRNLILVYALRSFKHPIRLPPKRRIPAVGSSRPMPGTIMPSPVLYMLPLYQTKTSRSNESSTLLFRLEWLRRLFSLCGTFERGTSG